MAAKPTTSDTAQKDFDDFLKDCPDADEPAEPQPLRVAGSLRRTKDAATIALMATDGGRYDIPRAAVTGFTRIEGGDGRMAELTLDRARLSDDLVARLKIPFETIKELPGDGTFKEAPWDTLKEIARGETVKEVPFDTLKEPPSDTLKEAPWDTFKEIGGGDTLKEIGGGEGTGIGDSLVEGIPDLGGEAVNPAFRTLNQQTFGGGGFPTIKEGPADTFKEIPADTLKELPGDGTRKEVPFDTLKELGGGDTIKEIGGGDTFKEGPADTLKELGGGDTFKEIGGGDTFKEGPADTLKELGGGDTFKEIGGGDTLKEIAGGEGTGIGDTLVEGIPQPGGELVNPQIAAARMAQPAGQAAFKFPGSDKAVMLDKNGKEIVADPKHIKEIVKEFWKEVAWEGPFGTGVGDSLAEGIFDPGQLVTNPGVLAQAAGGVPFVLATPHQASQGAVAQQMLAAQALAGRVGF